VTHALTLAYQKKYGHPCDVQVIRPAAGARVVTG